MLAHKNKGKGPQRVVKDLGVATDKGWVHAMPLQVTLLVLPNNFLSLATPAVDIAQNLPSAQHPPTPESGHFGLKRTKMAADGSPGGGQFVYHKYAGNLCPPPSHQVQRWWANCLPLYNVLTVQCAHCTVCSLYSVLPVPRAH